MPGSGENHEKAAGSWYANDPTGYAWVLQIGAALDSAEGLRELVELAELHTARVDGLAPGDLADEHPAALRVSPALRAGLDGLFDGVTREQEAAIEALNVEDFDLVAFEADPIAAAMKLLPVLDMPQAAVRLAGLIEQLTQSPDATLYAHAYMTAAARRPRGPRTFPAILSAVCSEAEQVVASVLRRVLFDTGGWPSVLDPALDNAVHKIIGSGGALDRWQHEIALHGAALKELVIEWPQLDEVFARRNLFLHRRGRVDEAYAKRAPQPAPQIGSVIELDAAYLREAIDRCEVLTVAIVTGLLKARTPQSAGHVAGLASHLAFTADASGALLRAEGYHHLAGALTDDPLDTQRQRVNQWLLRERRLGADAISTEVEGWDVSMLPREFALARHVLLREDEVGLALLAELRSDGTVTQSNVEAWPLFARWREHGLT